MTTSAVIADVRALLTGDPVFLAGSLVAADVYGLGDAAYSDIDIFCPTGNVLVATAQKLLGHGYTLDDRMSRVWERWLRYGFKTWHTNSLKLHSPGGDEMNLVYKLADGHPTTSLSQVVESFDFGLLGVGYDLETNTFRDARAYLFPAEFHSPLSPLPLMPNKRSNWRSGFISQYNGLREVGRYAKYATYGYDLSLVKDDLVTGYDQAWLYMSNHFDADKQQLGQIYAAIRDHIKADNITEMLKAAAVLNYKDSLDVIMAALE